MAFREAIRIALQSLWANKLRSILTLIGVVIGVASVIMVITLVAGANKFVATKVYGYGADVFTASKQPAVIFSDAEFMKYQKRKDLKYEAYEAIAERCEACSATGAMANSTGSVVYGTHSATDIDIRGWTSEMPAIYDINIERGRAFTPGEENRRLHIALIGPDIVDNQMGGEDPLGKEIRVDGEHYTVIGVGERKGKTLGQSQDNWVAVPLTTFLDTHGANRSLTLYARARGVGDPLELASDQVRVILRSIRHDRPGEEDSFSVDTNQTFVGIWQSISSSFFAVFVLACRHLARHRRHRHHEHHAGLGHRAHPRDRRPQGARRAPQRCHVAVPHRIRHHVLLRRHRRRHMRRRPGEAHHPHRRLPLGHQNLVGRAGPWRGNIGGHLLWRIPRKKGVEARSHRRLACRVVVAEL